MWCIPHRSLWLDRRHHVSFFPSHSVTTSTSRFLCSIYITCYVHTYMNMNVNRMDCLVLFAQNSANNSNFCSNSFIKVFSMYICSIITHHPGIFFFFVSSSDCPFQFVPTTFSCFSYPSIDLLIFSFTVSTLNVSYIHCFCIVWNYSCVLSSSITSLNRIISLILGTLVTVYYE